MALVRPFGDTGILVSALGFGAGHIGDPAMDESEAGRLLNEALDLGIRFIDTAPSYGLSEERIGRHLAHRRHEFVLATKCGYGVPGVPDWTPECISQGVDQALTRLRTDCLDILLFHSCPRHVLEQGAILDAIEGAVRAGKVRVAGFSGENDDLGYAVACGRLRAVESSVNLFDQRSLTDHLPGARRSGMGVIAKRPIANAPWRFAERPSGHYCEVYWDRMQTMGLNPGDLDWAELALRFSAFAPGVGTAIVGTSNAQNLHRNADYASRGPLPEPLVDAIRATFQRHGGEWSGQV